MKNSEDEILMYETESIIENAADKTAQLIIDDIHKTTERLRRLWSDARIRPTADPEGKYLHSEINRLIKTLQSLNDQFVSLHNMQLETASWFVRPNLENPPD